jgi:dTMP kinase
VAGAEARGLGVSDRFADSTRAYQGWGHGLDLDMIDRLYEVAVGAFRPDLTVILDLPAETGLARAASDVVRRPATKACRETSTSGCARASSRSRPAIRHAASSSMHPKDIDGIAAAIARAVAERLGA